MTPNKLSDGRPISDNELRDTDYATEIAHVALSDGDSEVRIEHLRVKLSGEDEIRFSWWKAGRLIPRPLDVPEQMLIELMRRAIRERVFSIGFVHLLRDACASAIDATASPGSGGPGK